MALCHSAGSVVIGAEEPVQTKCSCFFRSCGVPTDGTHNRHYFKDQIHPELLPFILYRSFVLLGMFWLSA